MMNDLYKFSHELTAPAFGGAQNANGCAEIAEGFACSFSITDEEAELQLPGYALAFEEYHNFRIKGASPEEALEHTLQEWRAMWRQSALVPHRRS